MVSAYLVAKFLHVAVAVIVGGTSASLGMWLEFFGRRAPGREPVLRGIRILLEALVLPGLVVQALLGVWLVTLGPWPWGAPWLQASMGLLGLVIASVAASDIAVRGLLRCAAAGDERAFGKRFRVAQIVGGLGGAAFLAIIYLMVTRGA